MPKWVRPSTTVRGCLHSIPTDGAVVLTTPTDCGVGSSEEASE